MEPVKYPIPQQYLTTAVEGLRELALRLEGEADYFARRRTQRSLTQAEALLEQARQIREAYEYFLHL